MPGFTEKNTLIQDSDWEEIRKRRYSIEDIFLTINEPENIDEIKESQRAYGSIPDMPIDAARSFQRPWGTQELYVSYRLVTSVDGQRFAFIEELGADRQPPNTTIKTRK
jgi:hypothetical protein